MKKSEIRNLKSEMEDLRARLAEAEETLRAIRSGEVDALVVSTERGEQIFTLRGADHPYRVLIEDMSEGALTLSAEGVILYANHRFAEMLQTPLEKVIGSSIDAWVAPADRGTLQPLLRKEEGKRRLAELSLVAGDGALVPVHFSLTVLQMEDVLGFFCVVVTDLSEQKRNEAIVVAERLARANFEQSERSRHTLLSLLEDQRRAGEALRQRSEELATVLDALPVFAWIGLDPECRVITGNRAANELIGAPPGTNVSQTAAAGQAVYVRQLKPDGSEYQPDELPMQRAIALGQPVRDVEIEFCLADGRQLHVLGNAAPLFTAQGQVRGAVSAFVDITGRKQAEEAVRRAEQRYRSLFEEAPVMYVITRSEGDIPVIADCNALFLSTLGYDRAAVVGRPLADFYTPASRVLLLEGGYQRALAGEFVAEERELLTRDGRVIPTLLRAIPETDAQGRTYGTRAMYMDITARKQAESQREAALEALAQERNLLRTLIDNLPDYIYVKDVEGRFVLVNVALARSFGKETPDEVCGKSDFDFHPPELAAQYHADELELFRSSRPFINREEAVVEFDGQRKWTLSTKVLLCDRLGEVIGLVGIGRDITERMQAQEALQQYAARLETMRTIDQATLAMQPMATIAEIALVGLRRLAPCWLASVVLLDAEAGEVTVLAVHTDGETWLRAGARFPSQAFHIAELQQGRSHVVEDIRNLPQLPPELQTLQAEGMRSFINIPLFVEGRPIGMLNLGADRAGAFPADQVAIANQVADQLAIAIQQARLREQVQRYTAELEQRVAERTAELKAANEQLQQLNRLKSEFVSNVSHELRTPLANIKGYLWLLEKGKPEKRAQYIETLHRESDLLQRLIEDLLHLSRLDLGKVQPVLAPVDINQTVTLLVSDRTLLFADRGLTLEARTTPNLPLIRADEKMLIQVLTNLMTNAMNYTPAGGIVTVSTAVRISDFGFRIPSAIIRNLQSAIRNG